MSKSAPPQEPSRTDPKAQGPKPDYPQHPIAPPGSVFEMTPKPDHGEQSYRGLGRLTDSVALITARHQEETERCLLDEQGVTQTEYDSIKLVASTAEAAAQRATAPTS